MMCDRELRNLLEGSSTPPGWPFPMSLFGRSGAGFVYEHGLWEVPRTYGDDFKVAVASHPVQIMDAFKRWI